MGGEEILGAACADLQDQLAADRIQVFSPCGQEPRMGAAVPSCSSLGLLCGRWAEEPRGGRERSWEAAAEIQEKDGGGRAAWRPWGRRGGQIPDGPVMAGMWE